MAARYAATASGLDPSRFERLPEVQLRASERAVGRDWRGVDDRTQVRERRIGLEEAVELARDPEVRGDRGEAGLGDVSRACRGEQRLVAAETRGCVVKVAVLDLRGHLNEERIARMALAQALDQCERLFRLVLVPDIQHVQLVIGFAAEQLAVLACALHPFEALLRSPPGSVSSQRSTLAAAGATSA